MDMAVASRLQRGHFQKEHMKSSIPTEEGACASPASSMLTIESLEAMANAEEMVAAANAVAFCMADVALKTPIVENYQRRLLATGCWRMAKDFVDPGDESPVILDPKLSYLLEEADAQAYLAQCAVQAAAAGLATRIPGNCPRTESEHQLNVLERHLMRLAQKYTGIDSASLYEPALRKRYIDTLMDCMGPQLKTQLSAQARYVNGVMDAHRAGTGQAQVRTFGAQTAGSAALGE